MSTSFLTAYLFTMAAGVVAAITGLVSYVRKAKPASPSPSSGTRFFGSQIGGKSVINYSYTDMPWRLMAFDVYYFFVFIWALPYILFPTIPADSGELDELALTRKNIFCIVVHFVLCILQLASLVAIPALILLPIWAAAILVGLFALVNHGLCSLLNGKDVEYHSDAEYAPALPEHAHEQWIFINGVAVGEHWMKNNLNRLAITFKRPILGIHNKTNGIIFDVVECLIQRNLGYATTDVRVCYSIIKEKLYNPQYSKVVFILHSQGGIEGSLILDWLLQELPQDLLMKLEVYTFGNAANHFNNPHRHMQSQDVAMRNPVAASTDSQMSSPQDVRAPPLLSQPPQPGNRPPPTPSSSPPPDTASPVAIETNVSDFSVVPAFTYETSALTPSAVSDRAIGHIEHYAHTTDFVALWGVLHFATSVPETRTLPRFIGRVFARTSVRGGHQFCQHYLDGMFPLARDASTNRLLTGVLAGCAEEGNEFMESEIIVGEEGDAMANAREAHLMMELSWFGGRSAATIRGEVEVEVHSDSPIEQQQQNRGRFRSRLTGLTTAGQRGQGQGQAKAKVKELSRLWQYRNGKSPVEKPPLLMRDADGVVRNATM
ncbi:hypothetical protein QBC46DRAFT_381054 [Diplogelasinospora grovesii]|uniref:Uncharacterized protein n=1 Tax=Diplogelasinospora grovesii TaxID=303347 RepID=A0AAN6S5N1_9PEZI|nr:hypothetical protein QBC46DRAFT_381054 [Diplogelasinospora grovesii]